MAVQAQKHRVSFKDTSKVVILPLFAFLDEIITVMKKYTSAAPSISFAEYLVISSGSDKHFSNLYGILWLIFVGSWLSYNNKSLECKLISTLLPCTIVSKINMFLKLRKFVMKTCPDSNKCLDDIHL